MLPTATQTAAQRKDELEHLLSLIAQHCPHYVATLVLEDSTSIDSVWEIIRLYYGFESSELSLMALYSIKQEEGERPQRLYHRLMSPVRDNLLKKDGPLKYDGATPTRNEDLSPVLERVIIQRWLEHLHPDIPAVVMRNFSYDLTCMTLKDLQPRICQTSLTMLGEVRSEDTSVMGVGFLPRRGKEASQFKPQDFNPHRFQDKPTIPKPSRLCAAESRSASQPRRL